MLIRRLVCLLLMSVLGVSCSDANETDDPPEGLSQPDVVSPRTNLTPDDDPLADAPQRDCATSIAKTNEPGTGALTFGPVSFDNMADWLPANPPTAEDGRYPGLKYPAGVSSEVNRLVLVVPEDARAHFALLFEGPFRGDNLYEIGGGHDAVIFEPCDDANITWFNGGFIVAGSQCAPLDVYINEESEATRILLPFQEDACP